MTTPKNKPQHIKHIPILKEKFLQYDSSIFSDYEILEILLSLYKNNSDSKDLAKQLLEEFNNINQIINSDAKRLNNIDEINDDIIIIIKIIKEIIIRNFKQQISNNIIIESWDSLIKYCQLLLINLKYEELHILFLDKRCQLIRDELYKKGSTDNLLINSKEIVNQATLLCASSVILVHNHPSGNIRPSKADIENTNKISSALKEKNIKIYDHIIIGNGNPNYYSFRNNGLILY